MSKAIGIDLGTTFSVAAYTEKGKVKVIPSTEGGNLVPSVVAFTGDGSLLVGKLARAQAVANPWQTVASVKRWMGTDKGIKLNGKIFKPHEISSFILSKVKREAEKFLGQEVNQAVITVPAYFNHNQRQATVEAAGMAGLEVMRIINEPTAASLAYGLHKQDVHSILIWDLGGGTFDVSILELGDGVFEVKAVSGNTSLGGDDWDRRIMDFLVEEFEKIHKFDLKGEREALQRLKESSEKAKIELSDKFITHIRIPSLVKGKDIDVALSREKFEDLTRDLLEKMMIPTRQALSDAGLRPQDIDRVILVGGSTRMPSIQQLAKEFFKKEPYHDIDPDQVVAMGAAIQAGILLSEFKKITLVDVTPLSLGIESMGGIFAKVIERNTPIPCTRSQVFTTAKDNQTQVDIHVLQGERALSSDNISVGKFILDHIPLARRGEPQIEVTFQIDTNGILQVSAMDLHTETQKSIKICSSKKLSLGQINKILEDARIHAEEDMMKKQQIRVGIRAESMIASAQMFMEESSDILNKSQMNEIEEAVMRVKRGLAHGKVEEIRRTTDELSKTTGIISKVVGRKRVKEKWSFI